MNNLDRSLNFTLICRILMHHRIFLIVIILVVLIFSIKELSARKVGLSNRLPKSREGIKSLF